MNPLYLDAYQEAIKSEEMEGYTPMSPESMLSLLSAHGISVECDDTEQWQQCEAKFSQVISNLHKLEHLREMVHGKQEVNRFTMESVESICAEAIDSNYPSSTYTSGLSGHQVEQSMEAIDLATILTIAAAVTAVAAAFYILYRLLSSDNLSSSVNTLDANASKLKAAEQKLTENEGVVFSKIQDDSSKKAEHAKIVAKDPVTLGFTHLKSEPRARNFIMNIQPGGRIFQAINKVNSKVDDVVDNFAKSFKMYEDVMRKYYEADPRKKGAVRKTIATAYKLIKGRHVDDIQNLELVYYEQVGSGEDGNTFFNGVVYESLEFYQFYSAKDATWLETWRDVIPSNLKRFDDKLNELEKTAKSISAIEERVKKEALEAKLAKASANNVPPLTVTDADTTAALSEYQQAITEYMKRLRGYRHYLNLTVMFYNRAMRDRRDLFMKANDRLRVLNK